MSNYTPYKGNLFSKMSIMTCTDDATVDVVEEKK